MLQTTCRRKEEIEKENDDEGNDKMNRKRVIMYDKGSNKEIIGCCPTQILFQKGKNHQPQPQK